MSQHSDYFDKGHVLLKEMLPREVASAYLSIMQKAVGSNLEEQKRFRQPAHAVTRPALELFSRNFPFSLGLLWGLTPVMEKVVGAKLLPSYAYGRVYPKGAQLEVHSDRKSNEHSLNLTLGYSDNIPWAFEIENRALTEQEILNPVAAKDFGGNDYTEVAMNPGDATAYRGVHFRHARLTPNPNAWSAHLFMGWVDRDGPFKGHAFDEMGLPRPAEFFFED